MHIHQTNLSPLSRRAFMVTGGKLSAGLFAGSALSSVKGAVGGAGERTRFALVGTGVRGVAMYGRDVVRGYGDTVELVGICDSNPGRLAYASEYIGAGCPTFVSLEEMLVKTKPQWLMVTTWDWQHHSCIIEGLKHGCNIMCEKPLTIDEQKARLIRDAEKQYGKKIVVTFNYRYAPHRAKLKEMLMDKLIGDITTVDFHWNITHSHLQRYMQRWHGEADKGGTLWVHKATHHFDLINWWLDSDPTEVFAFADLERFGAKGPFRGRNCRNCDHADQCDYYWDITRNTHLKRLYTDNEHHDGYIRDNCVFRREISIFDKHSAVVKYANNAYLNYSLTADTDYEGFWIAFNGTKGRIEGREGGWPSNRDYHEWIVTPRGKTPRVVRVQFEEGGHWGGDRVLMDRLFRNPDAPDPLHQSAGTRDGVMSMLVGVAARKSLAAGIPIQIAGLSDIQPMAVRPRG
ncbi:MAG TPA: Gfo/Idh/MocA family oxidoreductase [Phycisphaerales bacterium]|nr:Gfo/Idh/MocA family oxidoreductase [Phycisphaerales bacterium]